MMSFAEMPALTSSISASAASVAETPMLVKFFVRSDSPWMVAALVVRGSSAVSCAIRELNWTAASAADPSPAAAARPMLP
jgi:hypothetical protein